MGTSEIIRKNKRKFQFILLCWYKIKVGLGYANDGTKDSKKHGDYITKGEALYKLLNNHGYKIPKGKRNIDVVLLEDLNVPNGFKFYNDGGKHYVGEKPTKK